MTTLERILEWSKGLAAWQRDAVRRLLTQETLSDTDEAQVLAMLKATEGLVDPTHPAPTPIPLSEQHLLASHQGGKLVLKRLKNVANVNALVPGQELLFAHEGITVVYGENGTGKSGYARVLKRACRARDQQEKIHPNVFEGSSVDPASAVFAIQVDGQDRDLTWVDGIDKPDDLADIAVFDAKCARIILDKNNEPTYLPYGASVFEELAGLMKRLRKTLQGEMPASERPSYPEINADTEAGKMVASLSSATIPSDVEACALWTAEDEGTLTTLNRQITVAESENAQGMVNALRRSKGRLDKLVREVQEIDTSLSAAAERHIRSVIERAKASDDAAKKLASALSDEPLPEVGGEVWRHLYEAAKKYSLDSAYPSESFPATTIGNVCVWCMQPVSEQAASRLARFHDFMEGEIQRTAKTDNEAVLNEATKLESVDFAPLSNAHGLLEEIRERDEPVAQMLETYFLTVQARATSLTDALAQRQCIACPTLATTPAAKIGALATQLESEAARIEQAMKPEELAKLKDRQVEFTTRKALAGRKKEILEYLDATRTAAKYQRCIDVTHTTKISNQGRAIVSESLTPELLKSLADELKGLGAEYLPLNLKPSASDGETRHKLVLKDARLPSRTDLSDILSEGEQRVVAIAGFLAELGIGKHQAPIVLDDPVSSLDHRFRDRIAHRLSKEGAKRQVIILTHDIAFLLELKARAAENDVHWTTQTVLSLAGKPGRCTDGEPWHAKTVKERLSYIRESLSEFRDLYEADQDKYNAKAAECYGLLRETWERLVEEALLYEVIKCHGAEVQTMRLRSVTVTTEDYTTIDRGMSKCSKWMTGHRKSAAIDVNRPAPPDLETDIAELGSYRKKLNKRHKELKAERDKALEPPRAEIG